MKMSPGIREKSAHDTEHLNVACWVTIAYILRTPVPEKLPKDFADFL